MLKIAAGLELPLDFVTHKQAILAMQGAGKSHTASVQAEEMLKAGQHVVILDPTGAWWGLRAKVDGTPSDLKILIFGGDHADLPLESSSGEIVARSIIENRISCVLDLSRMDPDIIGDFVTPFLKTLYMLNSTAMHLIVDEADSIFPQIATNPGHYKMLVAGEHCAKRGRRKGIGMTFVTQNAQSLSKRVLTQCDMLFAMRMSHNADIKHIEAWVKVHGDTKTAAKMIEKLPSMKTGHGWLWWPMGGIFKAIHIRERETYDSGATPKPGATKPVVELSKIDLDGLSKAIRETVEHAKENDPKELKRKVRELEAKLAAAPTGGGEIRTIIQTPPELGPLIDECLGKAAKLVSLATQAESFAKQIMELVKGAQDSQESLRGVINRHAGRLVGSIGRPQSGSPYSAGEPILIDGKPAPAGMRYILMALVWNPGASRTTLAIYSGLETQSGGFSNYLSHLRKQGYIEGDGSYYLTEKGSAAMQGKVSARPSPDDLLNLWYDKFNREKCCRELMRVLVKEPAGEGHAAAYIAMKAGYKPDTGGVNNSMHHLRRCGIIDGKAKLRLHPAFLPLVHEEDAKVILVDSQLVKSEPEPPKVDHRGPTLSQQVHDISDQPNVGDIQSQW